MCKINVIKADEHVLESLDESEPCLVWATNKNFPFLAYQMTQSTLSC